MADLREAFRRAAKDKPNSELVAKISDGNRRAVQYEQEQTALERAMREANMIGHMWFRLRADPMVAFGKKVDWNISDIKDKWQKLAPFLLRVDDEKRTQVLLKMAEGMRLLRDDPHANYESMAQAASFQMSGRWRGESEKEFIRQLYPRVFLKVISELSGLDLTYEVLSVGDPSQRTDVRLAVESTSKLLPILMKP